MMKEEISKCAVEWLGKKKEKDVLKSIQKNIKEGWKISEEFKNGFKLYCEGNFEESRRTMQKILQMEKKADETKREIASELSKGIFLPVDREDLLRLALQVDRAIDEIEGAARRLTLFDIRVSKELRGELLFMADKVVDIFDKLYRIIPKLKVSAKEALRAADEVERMEEEIDGIHMSILRKILKLGKKKDVTPLLLLREVVENLENTADSVEDAVDILRILTLEYHA
jgi:hypothetical protein